MIATLPFIVHTFEAFNRLMFEGKLRQPDLQLSRAISFIGVCSFKRRRRPDGSFEHYDFVIRISQSFDLPTAELEDIILHEMIHYFIVTNQIDDTSAHGTIFRQLMEHINRKFDRHITVSHRNLGQHRLISPSRRWHIVAAVRFHNGKKGIKVLTKTATGILSYYNKIRQHPEVADIRLYQSDNPFFNNYPHSSALKVYFLDEATFQEQLKTAQPLFCDGREVRFEHEAACR